jgi:hypothetical protein
MLGKICVTLLLSILDVVVRVSFQELRSMRQYDQGTVGGV